MSPGELAALNRKFDTLNDDVVSLKVDLASVKASMLTMPKLLAALTAACSVVAFLMLFIERVK